MLDITYGSPDIVAMSTGAPVSQLVMQGVQQKVDAFIQAMGNGAIAASTALVNRVNDVMHGETARHVKAIGNQMAYIFQPDSIRRCESITAIQNAPADMERYIMAHPQTRELYFDTSVVGYTNYVDAQPSVIGNAHADYRTAVNGMALYDADKATTVSVVHTEQQSDVTMTTLQRCAIMSTWDMLNAHYEGGDIDGGMIDPTSKWNDLIS